ncbi:MAG: hypothetical protein ACLFVG_08715 [Candidatus Aminicenantes bacterium]
MRGARKNLIMLCLFLSSSLITYGIEVDLKISGALSYMNLNHINRSLNGWEACIKNAGHGYEAGSFREGDVENFHLGTAFEGEFLFYLSSHLAVGAGTGYTYGELPEKKTALTVDRANDTYIYVRPVKINAFPLNLSAYYFFPLREKLKLFIRAGMGFSWVKYVEREGLEVSEDNYSFYWDQKASAQGLNYFTGLGLTYEPDPFFRFFMEGEAELAEISQFQGKTAEGEKATLFFFEEHYPDLEFWRANNLLLKEEPSGENFRSVQKTVVDMSSFSVKIGVIIKF